MDHDALLVWVDANPSVDPARAGSLCRRHADALTAPRGWTLDDRRDPVPRLLRVPENPTPADLTPGGGFRRRKKRVETVDIPTLFAEIAASAEAGETAAEIGDAVTDGDGVAVGSAEPAMTTSSDPDQDTVSDPDETKAIAWSPTLGQGDAEVPQGRLLGRAFGRRRWHR